MIVYMSNCGALHTSSATYTRTYRQTRVHAHAFKYAHART